jgi:hypothetical protein
MQLAGFKPNFNRVTKALLIFYFAITYIHNQYRAFDKFLAGSITLINEFSE